MKNLNTLVTILTLSLLITLGTTSLKAQSESGKVFAVDHTGDSNDANPGDRSCSDIDGNCTLRAAIEESNATFSTTDIIYFSLLSSSAIDLTLGELAIIQNVYILGPGARNLTIRRSADKDTADFRIFTIQDGFNKFAHIHGVKIESGNAGSQNSGGGIYVGTENRLHLSEVVFQNNSAQNGGAIANAGDINIRRTLFDSNSSNLKGGAIYNLNPISRLNIFNSTFTGNSTSEGGAINNKGKLLLMNNTIAINNATNLGSSIVNETNAMASVINTIIASDNSPTATALSGSFNSLGNNIVTDARISTGFVNGVINDQVSDNNALDPGLESLSNNGGQSDTLALLSESIAIDNGNNCVKNSSCALPDDINASLDTDQRYNYSRILKQLVDVGSFERGATIINGGVSIFGFYQASARILGNSVVSITDVRTKEVQYSFVNPFGNFRFQNLGFGEIYVIEFRSKRKGFKQPSIIGLDSYPNFGFADNLLRNDKNIKTEIEFPKEKN